jgi:hypothetical protein
MKNYYKVPVLFDKKSDDPVAKLLSEIESDTGEMISVVGEAWVDFSDVEMFYYRDKDSDLNDSGFSCTVVQKRNRSIWVVLPEESIIEILKTNNIGEIRNESV